MFNFRVNIVIILLFTKPLFIALKQYGTILMDIFDLFLFRFYFTINDDGKQLNKKVKYNEKKEKNG